MIHLRELLNIDNRPALQNSTFRGICHDHRELKPGELFLAMQGKNTHGIDYAKEAIEKGAIGIISDKNPSQDLIPFTIMTDNPFKLAQEISCNLRDKYPYKIAAVTGSYGKTTTKDYLAELYNTEGHFTSSFANWNNLLGLTVNLSRLNIDSAFNIFECGISKNDEMQQLADLLKPELVIITSIGPVHLESLFTLENIAYEKLKLATYATTLLVGPSVVPYLKNAHIPYSVCSSNETDPFYLKIENNNVSFYVEGQLKAQFSIRASGRISMDSLSLSLAAAYLQGVKIDDFNELTLTPSYGRGSYSYHAGFKFIDETYNANINTIKSLLADLESEKNPSFLFLDDLLELGFSKNSILEDLNSYISSLKKTKVLYVGDDFESWPACLTNIKDPNDCVDFIKNSKDAVVAFKASRGKKIDLLMNKMKEILENSSD